MSRKVWVVNEILTAGDVNSYLMDQSVMSFAGTASRSSAIATATEGMVTFLEDNNQLGVALGTATWQGVNYRTITANTATTYTVSLADANTLIYNTGATAVFTVPDVLQIGQGFEIISDNATSKVVAGTAVQFTIDQAYNGVQVLKVAAGTYRVIGKVTG
jgi:hypothetical protein